jgi:hypothetical protein
MLNIGEIYLRKCLDSKNYLKTGSIAMFSIEGIRNCDENSNRTLINIAKLV